MGIRKSQERGSLIIHVDVADLQSATLEGCGVSQLDMRHARRIIAVDGSGKGKALKDPEMPTGEIFDIAEHETWRKGRPIHPPLRELAFNVKPAPAKAP